MRRYGMLILCIYIVCSLTLTACTRRQDVYDNSIEPDATDRMREYAYDTNVESDTTENMQELVYLLEEDVVGQGVFSSIYMSKTDEFIAELLAEIIGQHGSIQEDQSQYFSNWAAEQLRSTDWSELEEWSIDSYSYDSHYTITWFFGDVGYDFFYSFRSDKSTQTVELSLLIDQVGVIREVSVDIGGMSDMTENGIGERKGAFLDQFQERVIVEGLVYRGKLLLESDGQISIDAAKSAEAVGEMLMDVLESGGRKADIYEELFEGEGAIAAFRKLEWELLDRGWRANRYYDCYYIDPMEEGCVGFLYHFYPDYEEMGVAFAKAVVFRCGMDVRSGRLTHTELRMCPISEDEYHAVRIWMGQRHISYGGFHVPLPVAGDAQEYLKREDLTTYNLGRLLLDDLGEKKLTEGETRMLLADREAAWYELFADRVAEEIETVELETGWRLMEEYDCYYHDHNQQKGRIHYQFYFYWEKPGLEVQKMLSLEVWVSE